MTTTNPAERIARHHTNKRHRNTRPNQPTHIRAHATETDTRGQTIAKHGDPYQALRAATTTTPPRYLSITTSGWAAPTTPGDNTPPSLHPKRQRVSLAVVIDCQTLKLTSAVRMATEPNPQVSDSAGQSGPLADALIDLAKRLTTK